MNAQWKLNRASLNGALLTAGAVAGLAGFWKVFWLLVVVLVALAILGGDIRITPRHR